jgi:hypothetical protein
MAFATGSRGPTPPLRAGQDATNGECSGNGWGELRTRERKWWFASMILIAMGDLQDLGCGTRCLLAGEEWQIVCNF